MDSKIGEVVRQVDVGLIQVDVTEGGCVPAEKRWPNTELMLSKRRRRWHRI